MGNILKLTLRFISIILLLFFLLPFGCNKKQSENDLPAGATPPSGQQDQTWSPATIYYAAIDACQMPDGRLLVLYAKPPNALNFVDRVIRFDAKGNLEKEFDLDLSFPHSINPTGQGSYLISDHGHNKMVEIDQNGKVIRKISDRDIGLDGFNFNSGIVTGKNSVLASGRDWGIIEFNWDKKLLWKYQLFEGKTPTIMDKGSHDATILENGNVLYVSTTNNEVIEINRQGQKVRVIRNDSIRLPKNARRLKNGNTIIAHAHGITELGPKGKILRNTKKWTACYNFKVLPGGGLILAHTLAGIVFLDPDFQQVKNIRYNAPESWSVLQSSLPPDQIENLRSLGYLN